MSKKVGKIRKVLHFENEIEHKILVTYVISKVSFCVSAAFLFACSIKLQHIRPLGSFRWFCMSLSRNYLISAGLSLTDKP